MVQKLNTKLREQGKNPFYDYSLPVAILRLKQAIGRTSRFQDQESLVLLLDQRVVTCLLYTSSDMVLADDNFATIIVAVEEGRKVFSNIQKSIQYLLSANMAEVFTIFFATLLGWDVLQPVHLLWINLVTDTLPAIALGVEPAEPGVMTHKPVSYTHLKSSCFWISC